MTAAPPHAAPRTLSGQRILVMGLGRFGGGVGVTRWLASQGAHVTVTDLETEADLAGPIASIADLIAAGRVRLKLGGHAAADFTRSETDLVVANPAVPHPWDNPYLTAARESGVPITTEICLLVQRLPSRERTIGVTGSVGKSTTTAMIAHALGAVAGDTVLGGNIGGSLLSRLDEITPTTRVVLELSSAMLHWLHECGDGKDERRVGWSPHVAVLTNIAPNHVDWHGSVEHYTRSKRHIFRHQRGGERGDAAVIPLAAAAHADWLNPGVARAPVTPFPLPLAIPGAHNADNAAAALAACRALEPSLDPQALAAAIASFTGLPHRLQLAAEHDGIRFYNDSKSTTPEAALTAINAIADMPGMSRRRIHLIAGGYDKGIDLSPIAIAAADDAGRGLGGLYTVGQTGETLAAAARAAGARHAVYAQTVEAAVAAALPRLTPGDVLLLSPGCASWDQFDNYEQRGDLFIRTVRRLTAHKG